MPSGCSASVVPSNDGPACCSGLRRSWPGVRRCYAANNVAGIQGSNLTTTRTSPHVVNTRNRPRHFSADVAESPTGDHAHFVQISTAPTAAHHAHLPLCWAVGLSSQLPAPCPSLSISMRAVSGSIPPPRASVCKRGQACWYLNFCSLPDGLLAQGCKALHRQICSQQWLNSSAEEERHSVRAAGAGAGAGAGQQTEEAAPENTDSTPYCDRLAHLIVAVSVLRATTAAISIP